jgi:tRNA(adenine34) deaminase
MDNSDEKFMRMAIESAIQAREKDEVPIGACLVDNSANVLARSFNQTITKSDPTAHAEILVLRKAGLKLGNYRLTQTTLYTTIEPCVMCAGALVNARISRLVFGASDYRFGAVESLFHLCDNSSLNHRIEISGGVLAKECKKLMQDFFRDKRLKK